MSYPPPQNLTHGYKYPRPEIQKLHPCAMSCSARPPRRFPKRSGPPGFLRVEQRPLYKFCPTLYKFVQDKKIPAGRVFPKM